MLPFPYRRPTRILDFRRLGARLPSRVIRSSIFLVVFLFLLLLVAPKSPWPLTSLPQGLSFGRDSPSLWFHHPRNATTPQKAKEGGRKGVRVEGFRLSSWERDGTHRTVPGVNGAPHVPDPSATGSIPTVDEEIALNSNDEPLTPPLPDILVSDEAADQKLCGTSPCRVLLPGWIGEQESRAQQHVAQLGLLTSELNNRVGHSFTDQLPLDTQNTQNNSNQNSSPYVLVLPNVYKSRMGSCFHHPFDSYYDTGQEALQTVGISRVVTFQAFQEWVASRNNSPTAQIVMAEQIGKELTQDVVLPRKGMGAKGFQYPPPEVVVGSILKPSEGKHNYCLLDKTPRLRFSKNLPPITLYPPPFPTKWHHDEATRTAYGNAILDVFSSNPTVKKVMPDVFVVNWEIRWPVFDYTTNWVLAKGLDGVLKLMPKGHLAYHERWIKVATNVVSRLGPFVAIHWRMETVPSIGLTLCTLSLISSLRSVLERPENSDVRYVYLATDYPLEGMDSPHSSTFHGVKSEHHDAIESFLDAFNPGDVLDRWKLTTLLGELREAKKHIPSGDGEDATQSDEMLNNLLDIQEMDYGLVGILDKMIATRADFFFSGREKCARER